jgi:hypothetical protein
LSNATTGMIVSKDVYTWRYSIDDVDEKLFVANEAIENAIWWRVGDQYVNTWWHNGPHGVRLEPRVEFTTVFTGR